MTEDKNIEIEVIELLRQAVDSAENLKNSIEEVLKKIGAPPMHK